MNDAIMGKRFGIRQGERRRAIVVLLLVCSHLVSAVGLPLPCPSAGGTHDGAIVYPCQNHLCGCITAAQCWAGDCCCSTLEEKLLWADEQCIDPPDHVRPLVESRKTKSKSIAADHACCATDNNCPSTDQATSPIKVRWVVGLFAAKCRGDSSESILATDPAIMTNDNALSLSYREIVGFSTCHCDHAIAICYDLPTPPPRDA